MIRPFRIQRARFHRAGAGFTLVEALVAGCVLSLVLLSSYALIQHDSTLSQSTLGISVAETRAQAMLHGLERKLEPPAVLTGNAYIQDGDPLPTNWPAAIERFATSAFARDTFGEKFRHLYSIVKGAEAHEFGSHITRLEIARYLGPL